jgi:hypothetical protein
MSSPDHSSAKGSPEHLPRIGGMATMPSRIESLRLALPHILPQVDFLYLYLDKYEEIPEELKNNAKILPLLPAKGARNLGGAGKFMGLKLENEPCLYFCFDDDIVYHDGYVEHLATALKRYHYQALVGLHGCIYKFPATSYTKDRTVIHFGKSLTVDVVVDELGTGTLAFHSRSIQIDSEQWSHTNMSDLTIMIEAIQQKVLRICIRRENTLMTPIAENQPDSLYLQSLRDDTIQSRRLHDAQKEYADYWCMN